MKWQVKLGGGASSPSSNTHEMENNKKWVLCVCNTIMYVYKQSGKVEVLG